MGVMSSWEALENPICLSCLIWEHGFQGSSSSLLDRWDLGCYWPASTVLKRRLCTSLNTCRAPAQCRAEKVEVTASMFSVSLLPLCLSRTQAQWGAVTWGRECRSRGTLPRGRKDLPACNESLLHPHLREVGTLGTLTPPFSLWHPPTPHRAPPELPLPHSRLWQGLVWGRLSSRRGQTVPQVFSPLYPVQTWVRAEPGKASFLQPAWGSQNESQEVVGVTPRPFTAEDFSPSLKLGWGWTSQAREGFSPSPKLGWGWTSRQRPQPGSCFPGSHHHPQGAGQPGSPSEGQPSSPAWVRKSWLGQRSMPCPSWLDTPPWSQKRRAWRQTSCQQGLLGGGGGWGGMCSATAKAWSQQASSLGSAGAIQPDALGDPEESPTPHLYCPLTIAETPEAWAQSTSQASLRALPWTECSWGSPGLIRWQCWKEKTRPSKGVLKGPVCPVLALSSPFPGACGAPVLGMMLPGHSATTLVPCLHLSPSSATEI